MPARICRIALLVVLCGNQGTVAVAQTGGPEAAIDLGGSWQFRFDAKAEGESEDWFKEENSGDWQTIHVPGSFNDQFPRMNAYAGPAWYRTSFDDHAAPGRHTVLHMEGLVLRSKVWVNGKLAGSSLLPYTPLSYDITGLLHTGAKNTLVVETDNKILKTAIPDLMETGWQNDGGIIWPVTLTVQSPVTVSPHITTRMNGDRWDAHVQLTGQSLSRPLKSRITVRIRKGDATIWSATKKVLLNGTASTLDLSAALDHIEPWSPESPSLYHLLVQVDNGRTADNTVSDTVFGFRQIAVQGSSLVLNGKPLLLRGINRHSFYPGVGMTVSVAQTKQDFADIKALGANFVRLAHYPQPAETYEECDRLGLLVWSEIPVWQTHAEVLTDPTVWSDYLQPLLKASIMDHWNHPSVIVWSVANEIPSDKPEVTPILDRMMAYARQLDPSRLTTFASDKREHDVSFANVDFIAINEYYGWYYGEEKDLGPVLDQLHAKYPTKAIFVSEYGVESVEGWTHEKDPKSKYDFTFSHQVNFLDRHLAQIYAPQRRAFMLGGAPWLYNDFPLPLGRNVDFKAEGWKLNRKGLVTEDRKKKPAWDTIANFYHQLGSQAQAGGQ